MDAATHGMRGRSRTEDKVSFIFCGEDDGHLLKVSFRRPARSHNIFTRYYFGFLLETPKLGLGFKISVPGGPMYPFIFCQLRPGNGKTDLQSNHVI